MPCKDCGIDKRLKKSSLCRACTKKKRQENKRWLGEIVLNLKDKPCKDCRYSFPTNLMQFVPNPSNTKKRIGSINFMIRNGYSLQTLMNEVEKCDLICRRCRYDRKSRAFHLAKAA